LSEYSDGVELSFKLERKDDSPESEADAVTWDIIR